MNQYINDFYTKVDIDAEAVDRIISASKTAKPRKTVGKTVTVASVSAAVLVIGIICVWIVHPLFDKTPLPSYETITEMGQAGARGDALITHDGFAVAVEGAYSNGETIYVALFGDYNRWEWDCDTPPDTIRYSYEENDGSCFSVNDRPAELVTEDIVLRRSGGFFKGVMALSIDEPSSGARLEMVIPSFDIYSNNAYVKTISQPFEMEGGVFRAYSDNEEALLNGDNILYVKSILQYERTAVGDYICGISVNYYVPDDWENGGMDIRVRVFNKGGGEIALTRTLSSRGADGRGKNIECSFDFPDSRYITVALYDVNASNQSDPLQEYDVVLNDLSYPLTFLD